MTILLKKYIGYDCPVYATYLPTLYHQGETTFINKNSICIFEYTADHPLHRHTAAHYVTISRSQYLVVRSVSTVGNYDYTIEYLFYLDGSIEVKVRASGFVFATAWPASREKSKRENKYGYRVHDAASTSMHDHVLNFKADLDIAGTANTLERVSIEPYKKSYPWYDNDDPMANTMHLVRNPISSETGLNWAANSGSMFVVLNNDSTNAWGEKRGYRIAPGTGMGTPPHLTIINSTRLGRSAEYTAKDLWVVKQKDTEPRSANPMNYLEPDDPLVDFGKFVDGEDIEQEDL
jgi:primary-amine oxidase